VLLVLRNRFRPTIHYMLQASGRAEHISIESEPSSFLSTGSHRRRGVLSSYTLVSRLRGCKTELSISEDHYLSVHAVRPNQEPLRYEVDLRFANPKPMRVRHVSWFWFALSLTLGLLGGGALWLKPSSAPAPWLDPIFLTAIASIAAALGAAYLFLRRTTEALEFSSAHGGATLVSVLSGIGSARSGKRFFVELIKNINAAKIARPQPRAQLLRDEMREHSRLRELGVISQEQYEQSKARILASH
jgi:hypothetical protein